MEQRRYRPVLAGLEDRAVPSVTPSQVVLAFVDTADTTHAVKEIAATLGQPRTSVETAYLASYLTEIAQINQVTAPVLAQFEADLTAQVNAQPAQAGALAQFISQTHLAEVAATVNSAYAETYAVGFGAAPLVPPSPPVSPTSPVPPPGSPPTTTLPGNPAGSTLPFSLTDPAWQTLPSGVRIWDVTQGTGTAVAAGDSITVNYTGYLTNGTVFDSSYSRNTPFSTTLSTSSLIAGWVDGIPGMKPGGERRLDIPASLAYGTAGQGTTIPPNAELVFDITLISSP